MLCSVMTHYLMEWTAVSKTCISDIYMTEFYGGGGRFGIFSAVSPDIPCVSLLHSILWKGVKINSNLNVQLLQSRSLASIVSIATMLWAGN